MVTFLDPSNCIICISSTRDRYSLKIVDFRSNLSGIIAQATKVIRRITQLPWKLSIMCLLLQAPVVCTSAFFSSDKPVLSSPLLQNLVVPTPSTFPPSHSLKALPSPPSAGLNDLYLATQKNLGTETKLWQQLELELEMQKSIGQEKEVVSYQNARPQPPVQLVQFQLDHFTRQQPHFANILEFGSAPCRPVCSHMAIG